MRHAFFAPFTEHAVRWRWPQFATATYDLIQCQRSSSEGRRCARTGLQSTLRTCGHEECIAVDWISWATRLTRPGNSFSKVLTFHSCGIARLDATLRRPSHGYRNPTYPASRFTPPPAFPASEPPWLRHGCLSREASEGQRCLR